MRVMKPCVPSIRMRFGIVLVAGLLVGACDETNPLDPAISTQFGTQAVMIDPCPTCNGVFLTGAAADLNRCVTSPSADADWDIVDDLCELKIAQAFAPQLNMHPYDGYKTREPYWAARRSGPHDIQVMYMFAYHSDRDHYGDSEFIQITVRFDSTDNANGQIAGRWKLEEAFYSAHFLTPGDESHAYHWTQLQYPGGNWQDHPITWIAKGKHANYESQYACNIGVFGADTCEGNVPDGRLEIYPDRNIGSFERKLKNCVLSTVGPPYTGQECFWETNRQFWGWWGTGGTVMNYGEILQRGGWFD